MEGFLPVHCEIKTSVKDGMMLQLNGDPSLHDQNLEF